MNIFKQLAEGVNSEVTFTTNKEGFSVELWGHLLISKGGLTQEYDYWAKLSHGREGFVSIDEWDGDYGKATFNGLKLDSVDKFLNGFKEHGLSSVADVLVISHEELTSTIHKAIQSHEKFKAVFKKHRLFNALTFDEKRDIYYEDVMKGVNLGMFRMKEYGWVIDGEAMTKEEVEAYEQERK